MGSGEREREAKGGAFPCGALDGEITAEQTSELSAEGEADTCPTIEARRGRISLCKRLKDKREL